MKPLLFLTYKSFFNGVKRALSSPTRLIGLLFFVAYYFFWFVRPAITANRSFGRASSEALMAKLEFPPLETLDAIVFGGFAVLTMILMLGGLAQQGAFKPSDVDVLFPTPVHPRAVLLFRMIRDYLFTLIVPFLILLVGLIPARAGWEWLFRNMPNPEHAGMALRTVIIAWVLVAMCWVAINYSASLFVNRSDLQSDRNKRILGWGLATIVLGTIGWVVWRVSNMGEVSELLQVASAPLLRGVFFTATLATHLTMAPIHGSFLAGLLAGGTLVALIAVALAVAVSQAGWMYDQAAVKGFASAGLRHAQRQGDMLAAVAEAAKSGKFRFRSLRWVHRIKARGAWALVWKDVLVQGRGILWMLVFLTLFGVFMSAFPAFVPTRAESRFPAAMFLSMQALAIFTMTVSMANVSYLEVLRRIDLQKPLPFTPGTIVFFEVAAKAVPGVIIALAGALVATIVKPALLPHAFAAIIFSPALSLLLSSAVFLVIILFPDVEDQTQRQFRGVLMMLALAVLGLPPTIAFVGSLLLGLPSWIAALLAGGICFGIGLATCAVSGKMYASFNPSE